MKNDIHTPQHAQRTPSFEERLAVGRARLLHVWWDRGRLVWVPWLAAGAALFGTAFHLFK